MLLPDRAHAGRSEQVIAKWSFPPHIWTKAAEKFPQIDKERDLVDQGLRDWFTCCAWRGKRQIGMPSKLVDEVWHELILDTTSYVAFCRTVFSSYLHHFPDGKSGAVGPSPLVNTIWAWDRSRAGRRDDECSLWDLDRRLGVKIPWGVSQGELDRARQHDYAVVGGFTHSGGGTAPAVAAGYAYLGGCGSPGPGGCSGGSGGCGGGGCGGGGSGGG